MGWLFGCFPCRRRPKHPIPSRQSNDALGRDAVPVTAIPEVEHARQEDLYKVRQTPPCSNRHRDPEAVEFDSVSSPAATRESEKNSPAAKNGTEKSNLAGGISGPCGKSRPDPRFQVEELEQELENLTTKLTQEAQVANKLRDEVRYLRTCGELLESPNAFKKAIDNLEKSSGGRIERNGHSWLLPSVLAKIELEGASIGSFSAQPDNPTQNHSESCSDSLSENSNKKGDSSATSCSTKGSCEVDDKPIRNAEVQSPIDVPNKHGPASSSLPEVGKRDHLETFETTEDLLLEPIDGSSLITDSELVSSWENSFGKMGSSEEVSNGKFDQSLLEDTAQSRETPRGYMGNEATEEENELRFKSCFVIQKTQNTSTTKESSQCNSDDLNMLQHFPEVNQSEFSAVQSICFFSSDRRILEEDETTNKLNTKELECELMYPIFETSSSEEMSHSSDRVIEETDLSSGDIEESSKSFFAFSPDSTSESQSLSLASTCDGQAASVEAFTEETFSNTASSQSENASSSVYSYTSTDESGNSMVPARCFSPQFKSSRRIWSNKGKGSIEKETNSLSDQRKGQTMQLHPILDQHVTNSDEDQYSDALSHMSTQCSDSRNAINGESEGNQSSALDQSHCSDTSSSETWPQLGTLHILSAEDKNAARKNVRLQTSTQEEKTPQLKKMKADCRSSKQQSFHVQETESQAAKAMHSESGDSHENSCLIWTSDTCMSKKAFDHKDVRIATESDESNASNWPSDVSIANKACPDTDSRDDYVETSLSEWLKPSCGPQSCMGQDELQVPATSVEGTSKQEQTQSTVTRASSPEIQTPLNWMHSPQSPAKLADDRPILGTVAAHWSHISTTRKWWDGKGIPNSTNKYKEDQKVHWHATPFEVRLERALAKQGRVFQKKLFGGVMIA